MSVKEVTVGGVKFTTYMTTVSAAVGAGIEPQSFVLFKDTAQARIQQLSLDTGTARTDLTWLTTTYLNVNSSGTLPGQPNFSKATASSMTIAHLITSSVTAGNVDASQSVNIHGTGSSNPSLYFHRDDDSSSPPLYWRMYVDSSKNFWLAKDVTSGSLEYPFMQISAARNMVISNRSGGVGGQTASSLFDMIDGSFTARGTGTGIRVQGLAGLSSLGTDSEGNFIAGSAGGGTTIGYRTIFPSNTVTNTDGADSPYALLVSTPGLQPGTTASVSVVQASSGSITNFNAGQSSFTGVVTVSTLNATVVIFSSMTGGRLNLKEGSATVPSLTFGSGRDGFYPTGSPPTSVAYSAAGTDLFYLSGNLLAMQNSGNLRIINGTPAAPGLEGSCITCGLYLEGGPVNAMKMSAGGKESQAWWQTGEVSFGQVGGALQSGNAPPAGVFITTSPVSNKPLFAVATGTILAPQILFQVGGGTILAARPIQVSIIPGTTNPFILYVGTDTDGSYASGGLIVSTITTTDANARYLMTSVGLPPNKSDSNSTPVPMGMFQINGNSPNGATTNGVSMSIWNRDTSGASTNMGEGIRFFRGTPPLVKGAIFYDTNNTFHITTNGGTTDALTIDTSQNVLFASQIYGTPTAVKPTLSNGSQTGTGISVPATAAGNIDLVNAGVVNGSMRNNGFTFGGSGDRPRATVTIGTVTNSGAGTANLPMVSVASDPKKNTEFEITQSSTHVQNFFLVAPSSTNGNGVTPSTYSMAVSSTLAFQGQVAAAPFTFSIDTHAHINSNGTSPALTSCGSSPSIYGSDNGFTFTPGAGATGCVATFAVPFNNRPTCTATEQSGSLVNLFTYSYTNTAMTFNQTSFTSVVDVHCTGHD